MNHNTDPSLETAGSQPREMPPRRRLFEGGSVSGQPVPSHKAKSHLNLSSESFSVTEQAASLSSRVLIEGMSSSTGIPETDENALEEDSATDDFYSYHDDTSYREGHGSFFKPTDEAEASYSSELIPSASPLSFTPSFNETPPVPVSSRGREESETPTGQTSVFSLSMLLRYAPSVLVGLLLNILDGLSYGMILFPLGTPVFAGLESVGLSLFYISTVISQLVFSLGGSSFKSCIGSEMIEIVPFFHALATTISTKLEGYSNEEIIATTVAAYAVSCLITGLTFFLLGYLRLGNLVGFFPLHILLGCIGGVGGFLVLTGVEVASRVEGGVQFTYESLSYLMHPDILAKWGSCLFLGCLLMYAERRLHHPLVVPGILISIFVLFYLVIALIPNVDIDSARNNGWVFPAQSSDEPWYFVYSFYRPSLIHIQPIIHCIPVMFALTFFGLIHVPINIPALAAAVKDDTVNVNQELVAHGISNTISALCGSIQNYLVYTNSVMFVKSGADKPVAGVLLAIATFGVMVAGPVIIGYIPVMVVAPLIFMMGFDLVTESLVDTYGSVRKQDYATMLVIALTMGLYDFVVGIMAGIILACLFFVISSARRSPITAKLSGEYAHSTVIRHPVLQNFLKDMGKQVFIIRLSGPLFFGTNSTLEKEVRSLFDCRLNNSFSSVKYLIIDLQNVSDIDYCTVDTFLKMKRLLDACRTRLVLAGAESAGHKIRGLKAVDLVPETVDPNDPLSVRVFATLNIALGWCENQYIKSYYHHSAGLSHRLANHQSSTRRVPTAVPNGPHQWELNRISESPSNHGSDQSIQLALGTTPRSSHLQKAVKSATKEDFKSVSKWKLHKQPVPLIMQVVGSISKKDLDFWSKLADSLQETHIKSGELLPSGFHLIESGIFSIKYESGYYETTLAGTAFGELTNETKRTAVVKAEVEAKVWTLTQSKFDSLRSSHPDVAIELLSVYLTMVTQRYGRLTDYYYIAE